MRVWRNVLIWLLILVGAGGVMAWAQSSAPSEELPELEKCQAESLQLKATVVSLRQQLVQRETELAQVQLTREQARLEVRFRELLNPPTTAVFDWQTLTFKAPTAKE